MKQYDRFGIAICLLLTVFSVFLFAENRKLLRPRDTLLVLCNRSENPEYVKIGRVCRTEKEMAG